MCQVAAVFTLDWCQNAKRKHRTRRVEWPPATRAAGAGDQQRARRLDGREREGDGQQLRAARAVLARVLGLSSWWLMESAGEAWPIQGRCKAD